MDKALIRQRFAKATDSYDRQAGMQKHVARHMAEAIKSHIPDSDGWNVLEIGCGTGLFTREYLRAFSCGTTSNRFVFGRPMVRASRTVPFRLPGTADNRGILGLQYIRPAERKGSSLAHFRNVALPLIRGTAPDAFGRIPNRVQPGRNPTFHIPLTLGCAETFAGHRRDRPTKPEMDQRPTGRFLPTLP